MRIEIKEYCDIRRVENHIREVMQCQGQHCSFLQSMPYKNIQITLLLKLNRVISHDVAQHVHMGNGRFLHMHPCASVIEIVTMNEDAQKNNMEDAIPGDHTSSHFHHRVERKRKRNTNASVFLQLHSCARVVFELFQQQISLLCYRRAVEKAHDVCLQTSKATAEHRAIETDLPSSASLSVLVWPPLA